MDPVSTLFTMDKSSENVWFYNIVHNVKQLVVYEVTQHRHRQCFLAIYSYAIIGIYKFMNIWYYVYTCDVNNIQFAMLVYNIQYFIYSNSMKFVSKLWWFSCYWRINCVNITGKKVTTKQKKRSKEEKKKENRGRWVNVFLLFVIFMRRGKANIFFASIFSPGVEKSARTQKENKFS